ncbi:hypothetical protein [Vagococcus bubulae]|uniref:hypothetical protein n=1 Tax=Vagococcus bubulae TaxID=1977868 RepID=UPI0022E3FEA5|nr:hypothetical protein [Vagococcus bubulae]
MTELKELQAKFKELDAEKKRIDSLRAEANKINDEINKLNEKMKVSPSFDLTQKIGTLTSGKQSFDESLRQHEKAFESTVNKSYSHLRESANRHINNSIENVKEIDEAKKSVKKALNTLLEENNKLDQLVNKHWDKATEEVYSTNIERYADMIGRDYIAPSILMKPTGLTNHFIKELEKEIRNQE